jgi:hypothetical protein
MQFVIGLCCRGHDSTAKRDSEGDFETDSLLATAPCVYVSAKDDIGRYRANLQGEVDSAALYRAMADLEPQSERADVYRRLAAVEETHASFWLKRLAGLGAPRREPSPAWRTKLLILIAKRFGPDAILPTLRTLYRVLTGKQFRQIRRVIDVARSCNEPAARFEFFQIPDDCGDSMASVERFVQNCRTDEACCAQ